MNLAIHAGPGARFKNIMLFEWTCRSIEAPNEILPCY